MEIRTVHPYKTISIIPLKIYLVGAEAYSILVYIALSIQPQRNIVLARRTTNITPIAAV